jgi:hypothetical protein
MTGILRIFVLLLGVGGCALIRPAPAPAPAPVVPAPADVAQPEAPRPAPAARLPATTIASLGNVREGGLWMRTPLVSAPMRGRVSDPATGREVVLDLLPLPGEPGAGSRLSLGAYQALGLPLTALPELRVAAAG